MNIDYDIVKKICDEMQITMNPNQDVITIGGKKLPDDFSVLKLFRGEYDETTVIECSHCEHFNLATNKCLRDGGLGYFMGSCLNQNCTFFKFGSWCCD